MDLVPESSKTVSGARWGLKVTQPPILHVGVAESGFPARILAFGSVSSPKIVRLVRLQWMRCGCRRSGESRLASRPGQDDLMGLSYFSF